MIMVPAKCTKRIHTWQHILVTVEVQATNKHSVHVAISNKSVSSANAHHASNGCAAWRASVASYLVVECEYTADDVRHLLDKAKFASSLMPNVLHTVLVCYYTTSSPLVTI